MNNSSILSQIGSGSSPFTSGSPLNPQQQTQTTPQTNTQTAQPTTPTDSGNWLTHLIPAAASTLGALGGMLVPIPGLDIAASAALSGIGGGIGKGIENAVEGNKDITQGVGGEALGSGAMGLLGGGIGEGLSALGSKVIAPLAEKGAARMIAGQAAKGEISPELAGSLQHMGITDLSKAGQLSNVLTGNVAKSGEGQALLTNGVESVLGEHGSPVQLSDITAFNKVTPTKQAMMTQALRNNGNVVQNIIDKNGLTDNETNQVRAILNGLGKSPNAGEGFSISGETSPLDALNVSRGIGREASGLFNKVKQSGFNDTSSQRVANALHEIGQTVNGRLGLDDIQVPQEVQKALADDILTHGGNISPTAAKQVADAVQQPGLTLGGLRNLESNWVQVSNALRNTANKEAANFGTSTSQMARSTLPVAGAVTGLGGKKAAAGAIGGVALNSKAADVMGAKGLSLLSRMGSSPALNKATPAVGAALGASVPNLNNAIMENNAQGQQQGVNAVNNGVQQMNNQTPEQAMGGINGNVLSLLAVTNPGALASLVAAQQPQIQQANAARAAETALGNLPSAPNAGIFSSVLGNLGIGSAGAYQRQAQSVAQQVAKAIPGADPNAIAAQLTNYMAGGGNIEQAVNSLLSNLGTTAQQNSQPLLAGLNG